MSSGMLNLAQLNSKIIDSTQRRLKSRNVYDAVMVTKVIVRHLCHCESSLTLAATPCGPGHPSSPLSIYCVWWDVKPYSINQSLHLMNVEQSQAAADPQIKPTNLTCESI